MPRMLVENNVALRPYNTFGIVARAHRLVRIAGESDVHALLADPALAAAPKFVLGGGSNIVLTGDVRPLVLVNPGVADPATCATGGEVMTLAKAIQTSVYERFGILLEPEPVVV